MFCLMREIVFAKCFFFASFSSQKCFSAGDQGLAQFHLISNQKQRWKKRNYTFAPNELIKQT